MRLVNIRRQVDASNFQRKLTLLRREKVDALIARVSALRRRHTLGNRLPWLKTELKRLTAPDKREVREDALRRFQDAVDGKRPEYQKPEPTRGMVASRPTASRGGTCATTGFSFPRFSEHRRLIVAEPTTTTTTTTPRPKPPHGGSLGGVVRIVSLVGTTTVRGLNK